MDITQPLSGVPAPLLPFKVLNRVLFAAINNTPFKGLVGSDPESSPIIFEYAAKGMGGKIDWGMTPDFNDENVASGYDPYSNAVDSKKYAACSITLDKIKWSSQDKFQDYQRIATPLTDPNQVILELSQRKFEKRFIREVLQAMTFGGKGVVPRFRVGVNGSKPVSGRLVYGDNPGVGANNYAPNNGNDLKTQVHTNYNADGSGGIRNVGSVLTTRLFRSLSTFANAISPQNPLNPAYIIREKKFSEIRKFWGFFSPEAVDYFVNNDEDFKQQQLGRGVQLPGQANPMVSDRHVCDVGSISVIKCVEMSSYTSFTADGNTYDIGCIMGADALRICQSSLDEGLKVMTNIGTYLAEREEAVTSLYSYFRGYKVPRYFNKATQVYNDGTDPEGIPESGLIYVVTKRQ